MNSRHPLIANLWILLAAKKPLFYILVSFWSSLALEASESLNFIISWLSINYIILANLSKQLRLFQSFEFVKKIRLIKS